MKFEQIIYARCSYPKLLDDNGNFYHSKSDEEYGYFNFSSSGDKAIKANLFKRLLKKFTINGNKQFAFSYTIIGGLPIMAYQFDKTKGGKDGTGRFEPNNVHILIGNEKDVFYPCDLLT